MSARCSVRGRPTLQPSRADPSNPDLVEHPATQLFDRAAMLALDGPQQIGPRAEVVAHGGVVALLRSLTDLPVRHGVHPALGEQSFGRQQDRLASAG